MLSFDTKAFQPAIGWARRHEGQISALSLAGGFAFDSLTFGRIDHAVTQAVFIVYLLVAGVAIAVLHVLESRPDAGKPSDKTHTILVAVTQFALGCLLSGFCVFYIRSASITSSMVRRQSAASPTLPLWMLTSVPYVDAKPSRNFLAASSLPA